MYVIVYVTVHVIMFVVVVHVTLYVTVYVTEYVMCMLTLNCEKTSLRLTTLCCLLSTISCTMRCLVLWFSTLMSP